MIYLRAGILREQYPQVKEKRPKPFEKADDGALTVASGAVPGLTQVRQLGRETDFFWHATLAVHRVRIQETLPKAM